MATTSETASAAVTTPVKRTTFSASAEAGPSRARTAVASPAYVSGKSSIKKAFRLYCRPIAHTVSSELSSAFPLRYRGPHRHRVSISLRIVIHIHLIAPGAPFISLSPGSRIWKVGFSGEPDPRAVFWAQDDPDTTGAEMWEPDLGRVQGVRGDREEGNRLVGVRLLKRLKETFVK